MNLKRGLFRVWLVLTGLFILAVALFSYDRLKQDFEAHALLAMLKDDNILVPVDCGRAMGVEGRDYSVFTLDWEPSRSACFYKLVDYRRLFPADRAVSDKDLSERLNRDIGTPRPSGRKIDPWGDLLGLIAFAIGYPLAILAAGSSLYWAFAGFAGRRT